MWKKYFEFKCSKHKYYIANRLKWMVLCEIHLLFIFTSYTWSHIDSVENHSKHWLFSNYYREYIGTTIYKFTKWNNVQNEIILLTEIRVSIQRKPAFIRIDCYNIKNLTVFHSWRIDFSHRHCSVTISLFFIILQRSCLFFLFELCNRQDRIMSKKSNC